MSGAFPISTAKFNSLGIKSIQNSIISKTDSGKRLVRQIDGQRWAFSINIITGKRSDVYAELMAFMVKQKGQFESFSIQLPELKNALGNETGTVSVDGVHAVGDNTIAMDGFAGDGAGRLKAGDFIKFNAHGKVYMVVADVTSSSNAATVTIEPPLTTALSNNEVVTYDSVPFQVYSTSDLQEFGIVGTDKDGNLLYKYELDVEEAL